jgi:hypothetical protein
MPCVCAVCVLCVRCVCVCVCARARDVCSLLVCHVIGAAASCWHNTPQLLHEHACVCVHTARVCAPLRAGAGMDTRAWRLPWPPGTTVWEVDTHQVLSFKDQVLAQQPAPALRCSRRVTVAADARQPEGGLLGARTGAHACAALRACNAACARAGDGAAAAAACCCACTQSCCRGWRRRGLMPGSQCCG